MYVRIHSFPCIDVRRLISKMLTQLFSWTGAARGPVIQWLYWVSSQGGVVVFMYRMIMVSTSPR